MWIKNLSALVIFTLFGCASTDSVVKPTTSDPLTALTSEEITTTFTGNTFQSIDGSWTWDFGTDGVANSKAKDGSWEDVAQKWSVEGDKLCRSLKDTYPCVSVYRTGDGIKFGKVGSAELETWTIEEL